MNIRAPNPANIFCMVFSLCLMGCASQGNAPGNIETQLTAQRYDLALQTLEGQRREARDELI